MRKILLLAVMLLAANQGWAGNVNQASAREIARQFLSVQAAAGRMMAPATGDLELKYAAPDSQGRDTHAYYIFNSLGGFVVVAGDDRAQAILAYGDQPILDMATLPSNMKYWLACYQHQIEFLQANPTLKVDARSLNAHAGQTVNPLLTANWSQNAPYWNECPAFGNDTCYTGCPATSLSMVFHYWKYPRQQTPAAPSYEMPSYGVVLPELPPTVFDWANMLDDYTNGYTDVQAAAVAHLMRYIGQVEEMDYTISGSGAYGRDVLRSVKYFEYDENAQLVFKTDDLGYVYYNDAQWGNLIQTELSAGRPIVYLAYDNYTGSGHAFNVDGYDADNDTYHINWGWNGRGNGHFALNAFSYGEYTFGTGQQMVIGIQPPEGYTNPRLQAYPNHVELESYINKTATAIIHLKGTNLTHDVTLNLNDADGVFAIDASIVSCADAENGKDITVTYSPTIVGNSTATIVCTCEDTDPVTITLNGVAPLEVYAPVMQPANAARVTLTSFRADWTDATPDYNVTSYTLEVNAKPAFSLLEEADFSGLPKESPTNQASHATDYLPEGWSFSGSEFNLEGGCIMPRRNSVITTDALDFKGYDKVTVEVLGRSYGSWGDPSELIVSTSLDCDTLSFPFYYEAQTVVLDCAETDQITFKCGYYPMIQNIKIYAGDATQGAKLRATETGDADYRLIEGIKPGKSYTVGGLTSGGTFIFKVKTLYVDGTESEWSNAEMVTLVDGGHDYNPGDVNHDGVVDVTDVTVLISHILGVTADVCPICADVDADGTIDVSDVTALIQIILVSK